VEYLNKKYSNSVFGKIKVWDAIEKLSIVIDPTDKELYGVSQFIHTIQVLESMENDKIEDEYFIIGAIIHDLGKLLLLTDEDPANIVCNNTIIGNYKPESGLDNCIFQWNHDEYAYLKFKDYLPENISWLIRYHSIRLDLNLEIMNDKDRMWYNKYLVPFRKYDKSTKSIFNIPNINIKRYQKLIEKYFPNPVYL
jgi:hypothetical protein